MCAPSCSIRPLINTSRLPGRLCQNEKNDLNCAAWCACSWEEYITQGPRRWCGNNWNTRWVWAAVSAVWIARKGCILDSLFRSLSSQFNALEQCWNDSLHAVLKSYYFIELELCSLNSFMCGAPQRFHWLLHFGYIKAKMLLLLQYEVIESFYSLLVSIGCDLQPS